MTYTATYSPEDNKLRLYASSRLDAETYARAKKAGFRWAPKQDLFFATWCPLAEDICIELAGEIDDEDKSLVERAEERSERFEGYSENRTADAESARKAVAEIADGIPFGQPILIGHHSEKHARRDAEKIENGMRKAVRMWETAKYWEDRAQGAIRHAKYKERPDVRARRIKTIEAEVRSCRAKFTPADNPPQVILQEGWNSTNGEKVPHVWCAPRGGRGGSWVKVSSLPALEKHYSRWIAHLENRLTYERAMMAEAGGTVTDKSGPEVGGGVRCWATNRGRDCFSWVVKVNKVSVTVYDNWHNPNDVTGGRNFTRTIPFDKCTAVISKAEVDAARAAGRLVEMTDKTGFIVVATPPPQPEPTPEPEKQEPEPPKQELKNGGAQADMFAAMKDSLRAGVKVVSANQLFPTPPDLAARMVELADIEPGQRVLEPSAGTGNILRAIIECGTSCEKVAVEINQSLADRLHRLTPDPIICNDFLQLNGGLGKFDRIVMNPPFENGSDIKHIRHAMTLLEPGGILVAICANGPRQNSALRPLAEGSGGIWEELPEGTFAGTGVRAVLVVFHEGEHANGNL